MNEVHILASEADFQKVSSAFQNYLDNILKVTDTVCFLLSGQMGAGKTTFVREILKSMGSKDQVNSPTFNLHQTYEAKNTIIHHFDLYRIHEEEEIFQLGFEELWGKEGISFIEWWDRASHLLPKEHCYEILIYTNEPEVRGYVFRERKP